MNGDDDSHRAGAEYVLKHPDFRKLERLAKWKTEHGADGVVNLYEVGLALEAGDVSAACGLANDLCERYGVDTNEGEWTPGFVDGALAKHAELTAKL